MTWLKRVIDRLLGRHTPADAPPLPAVEPLPRPPEHDPAYHALAQRQTVLRLKSQQWERQRTFGQVIADVWRDQDEGKGHAR